MAGSRKYNDEDVRAILDRALKQESPRDVSHEELVAIGSEVGISREAIDVAAREVEERGGVEAARQRVVGRRRRRFVSHAWSFALVNAFLFAINFLTTPGEWWVLFPVFGWGLAVLLHARFALSREVSDRAIAREQKRMQANRALGPTARAAAARVRVEDAPEAASNVSDAAQETGTETETARRQRSHER